MRVTNIASVAAAVVALGAMTVAPASASAQSELNFNGSANLQNQPGSNGSLLLIDFLSGTPPTVGGTATGTVQAVPTVDSPFSGTISSGTQGTIQDLVVSGSNVVGTSSAPSTIPISNFLTIGGYTFSLITGETSSAAAGGFAFGPITVNPSGARGSTATFAFNGLVSGPGLGTAPRAYEGVFTAQFSNRTPTQVFNTINNGGMLRAVSFSANISIAAVPEPATFVLMGTGLLGLVGVARRRRRSA